jgi:predicted ArsR family transcriptional regulator
LTRLNPIKQKILAEMVKEAAPRTPKEIANKVGLNFSSCMMHLLGLKKAGYVSSPEKGRYEITSDGREALKPQLGRDDALYLLSPVAHEKAFHFYTALHQYTGTHANSLCDFCEKIKHVDTKSIEFHFPRKDFDNWFASLGDHELARQLGSIREKQTSGDKLRKLIYETVKRRCDELTNLARSS